MRFIKWFTNWFLNKKLEKVLIELERVNGRLWETERVMEQKQSELENINNILIVMNQKLDELKN